MRQITKGMAMRAAKIKRKRKCEFDKNKSCRALVCRTTSRKCKARDSFGLPRYSLVHRKGIMTKNEQIRQKDALDSIKG